ncbi:hypothetical protein [Roseovarius sp. 2305UL8-3]|uniref:hypothetical protein n=1 Tax=Roseovarius conchicola TaxID=3121636 RepID=UPI0035278C2C
MTFADQIDPVIDRLGRIVDNGQLPHPYDRWGARLLEHLTKPVQVVVTGFPGTGKSALIEMMSARPVLGHGIKAPIVELAYGETEQLIIERRDGSVSSIAGVLKDCDCPDDAVRIRQELPDNKLISNDFIEMGLHGDMAQKRTTLEAAIERADLVVWCSQDFGEEEQLLWSMVPDKIKDHSLLVLTMADQQLMRGMLSDTIDRLNPIVAEEFLGLFPVATIQGITAQTSADTIKDELWTSSGGRHLMELLMRQVRQGRTADFDQARIFMDRLAVRMPQIAMSDAEPPVAEHVVAETDTSEAEPPAENQVSEQHDISLQDMVTTEVAEADLVRDTEAVAVLSEAVDLLQQHSARMLDEMDESGELDTDRILTDCTEAIHSISDLLLSTGDDDPAKQAMNEHVQEGEEMLMLFQLERGEDAALDAVTLMLQIRKELSQKLAV